MLCIKCKKEIPDESVYCLYCGWQQSKSPHDRKTKSRGNGTGSVYQLPDGRWKVEVVQGYYRQDGKLKKKRRTKVFVRKKDALAAIPILQNKKDTTKITFNALYDLWSKKHYANLSKSKETAYKIAYAKCDALYFSDIKDIKVVDLQDVVDKKGTSYYTKRDIKVLFNQMWKYAMQNDFCDKNYASYIELPPFEKSNKDAFKEDEINKLWKDYEDNPFTAYILIMIYTGMRYGELSTVLNQNIHLNEQYLMGGIKTEEGKLGKIIICDKIKPVIQKCMARTKKKLLEMNEDNFRKYYDKAVARADVRPLRPHCCRHTTATALALAGVPPAIIKAIMRHKNYSTTIGYTHIKVEDMVKELNKI